MLVAWNQYLKAPESIRLVRKKPGKSFAGVPVPAAGLVSFGDAYLTEDRVNDRILLTSEAHGPTLDDLGLYVWTSKNDGHTWSKPVRVWDSFASGQIALDGKGGFWAITDQTWAVVAHVPATLAIQHWPDDHVVLSDRFASRGAVDVATIDHSRRLLFAWGDGANEAWIHVGDKAGQADDVRVMKGLYADGAVKLGSIGDRAVLGGIRQVSTPAGNVTRLYAVGLVAFKTFTAHYAPRLISAKGEDVVDFGVSPTFTKAGKPTGHFEITWVNSDGQLRTSSSGKFKSSHWTIPQTVLTFPAQGYANPTVPDVTDGWAALHSYDGSGREVEIAVPTG